MFNPGDTIVAVSSAAGPAGRSIVRLSGPEAVPLAEGVFSRPLAGLGGFRALDGVARIEAPYRVEVPCRAYLFRAPRSYTRQDVVELHVPGEIVASVVCSALLAAGARQAEAGEFTARAFFSGRLDLSAAEAVADVIDAEADAQLRSAVAALRGGVRRLCEPAAEALTEALATVEAGIDFADEDIELAAPADLVQAVERVAGDLEQALVPPTTGLAGGRLPHVAITGRPNAGKSSLLNALSGADRAIVSVLAGTTRDVLSAPARLPGAGEIILLDAAGLDASPDPLARASGVAARQAAATADAVLFVLDPTAEVPAQADLLEEVARLNPRAPLMVLANKMDLLPQGEALPDALRRRLGRDVLPVSAATGEGLGEVMRLLGQRVSDQAAPQPGGLLLHERQRGAMAESAAAARRAVRLLRRAGSASDQAELVAVELRAALAHLGEITGQVVSEDVLARIFSRFCIGK